MRPVVSKQSDIRREMQEGTPEFTPSVLATDITDRTHQLQHVLAQASLECEQNNAARQRRQYETTHSLAEGIKRLTEGGIGQLANPVVRIDRFGNKLPEPLDERYWAAEHQIESWATGNEIERQGRKSRTERLGTKLDDLHIINELEGFGESTLLN